MLTLLGSAVASAAPGAAPGAINWQPNVETAQRVAAQTNRLVLLHFWAPWCKPCMKLDSEVFSQPQFGPALEANFVPVKVNSDEAQATARQYGITTLPIDVVITPQGRLVTILASPANVDKYIEQLNHVAASHRQLNQPGLTQTSQVQTSQVTSEGSAGSENGYPIGAGRFQVKGGQPTPTGDRFLDAYATNGANSAPAATAAATVAAPAAGAAAVGYNQPPAAAPAGYQPPAAGAPPAAYGAPPATPYNPQLPANTAAATAYGVTPPPASNYGPNATPQGQPAAVNYQAPIGPGAVIGSQAPRAGQGDLAASGGMPQIKLPPGSPPVGMDGYCPVTLVEQKRWVLGDTQWGAVHRGRTYLFKGPEEQKRFLANPDTFSPVMSGIDPVVAIDQRQVVPGMRKFGVFYGNRIYLFSSDESLKKFDADKRRYSTEVLQATHKAGRGLLSLGLHQATRWCATGSASEKCTSRVAM